jgi:hypothetical protein
MKLEEMTADILAGATIHTAQVAVCKTLKQSDAIRNALEAMKQGALEPRIYTFAAGDYLVVVMGDKLNGGTDVQNTNT